MMCKKILEKLSLIEIARKIKLVQFFFYLKLLFTNYNSKIIRLSLNRIALLASDPSLISKLYRKFRTLNVTKLHCSIPISLVIHTNCCMDINAINDNI